MPRKKRVSIAGPWRQDKDYVSAEQQVWSGWNIHDHNGQFVCTISNSHDNGQHQASLIAGAPDLLAICETVLEYERERQKKDDHHFHDEDLDDWEDIIDKARGRTPKVRVEED